MSSRIGKRKMRRKEYETVKKMDVKAVLLEIKGVGEKRADIIMERLREKIEGNSGEI